MVYFIFYTILLIILILTYVYYKNYKINIYITLICTLLIINIIYNPSLCVASTLKGTKIFFNSVFAPLFIFLIFSNLIIEFDGIRIYSKLFGKILCSPFNLSKECSMPIILSLISGYPLGAKYSCDLYQKKIIDRQTCQNLLNIASNPSPIFMIGTIGLTMLHNIKLGYILLISNYLSCFIMAILLKSKNSKHNFNNTNYELKSVNVGQALKKSIDNAIYTSLSIGGFITLFVVLTNIIEHNKCFIKLFEILSYIINVPSYNLKGFVLGLLEMTNGCYIVSTSNISIYLKLIMISFFTSFSGISITLQVYSFTYKYNLCMKQYICRKLIQGLVCAIVTSVIYFLFINNLSINTFNINHYSSLKSYYIDYYIYIGAMFLPFIFYKLYSLFHTS